ncbi:MAG: VCBS repeat-containing protein [Flavisolibacter sp.]|nr:VCBS repeat-containing protein [Flavisolibacter sp.]
MSERLLMVLLFLTAIGCKSKQMFEQVDSSHSSIHFNNLIQDNDTFNVLDVENIYNGGGVGIGDFNNDGLQDIYFTGNAVPNKLYLNKGDFKFQDVTEQAGVTGDGRWSRGVSVVDINSDGLPDLYVCATLLPDNKKRENLLYINKGADANGIPHFENKAPEYGLADTSHSTMAAFFDYDNDGDLDMYLLVNEIIKSQYPNTFRPILKNGENPNTDKLFRNDWSDSLQHPVFTNVSKEAGITIEGYGHGVTITDINKDGRKDIYVSNDFLSNNILYINNGPSPSGGVTFTDEVKTYFKHTSENAMGQDVIDMNNDGLADVIELDMNPEDNYRKKMMMNPLSYQRYQNNDYYDYQYQYVRNIVQINQGPRVNGNDSIGAPVFSDIAFYSGIAETDWSWTPSVADFDNDGFRDIIITNGFPKDVTDHDFIAFRNQAYAIAEKKDILEQIPIIKISNYAYKNNGDLTFKDVTKDWGMSLPTFSNGAAYADLDNDGDLDIVINNINDEALVYENKLQDANKNTHHYLSVKLIGDSLNRNGLGTWVELYYDGKQQVYEQTPYRGYLSSVQVDPHFGLGAVSKIDSLVVKWPNGKKQVLNNVGVDQALTVKNSDAQQAYSWLQPVFAAHTLFTDITDSLGIRYQYQEADYIDFNIQKLLPHKFSEYGPALAAGDVNADGLEDVVIGGSMGHSPVVLLQQQNGTFTQNAILPNTTNESKPWEDMGILLFDADGDGDLDLYTASGGFEHEANSANYEDKLYINDGKGAFTINASALPKNFTSKSCVRAADFDRDGDLDLFIAGRVEPWKYPQPVSSFIYRNDSENGVVKFTDVTGSVAKSLNKIGMVCDAVWTDFDNDGWQDLVLTGEWMPISFLKNNKGVFENSTSATGIAEKLGWWTSIVPGDFDNDGDIDYIVGNLGLNSYYRASEEYPVKIYAKDFDNNGNYDAVPTLFLPASQKDPKKKEFAAHLRDDMTKQMIIFKSKFQNYKSYAEAPFKQMFTPDEMKDALVLQANDFSNSYIKNMGGGKFEIIPLPTATQFACLNGMLAEDFDGDGNLDVLITGNDYGTEVSVGRYDACNGLFLKGDGKGGFSPLSILQSGWFVPGDAKALVKVRSSAGGCLLMASQNKGRLKVFECKKRTGYIPLDKNDVSAVVYYKDGKQQLREIGYGASFLSQSGRFLNTDENMASVEIKDYRGTKRKINIP